MINRKVRIKTWEEMEKEFGLDNEGIIKCLHSFLPHMERDLPLDRIIEMSEKGGWNGWNISKDIIEEVLPLEITLEELEKHFGCKIKII